MMFPEEPKRALAGNFNGGGVCSLLDPFLKHYVALRLFE